MQNIERLLQLTVEFEGLLHILTRRDDAYIHSLLKSKYAEIATEFSNLQDVQPQITDETSVQLEDFQIAEQPEVADNVDEYPEDLVETELKEIPTEIDEIDQQLTDIEVKDQEAEEAQITDEIEAATHAIEHEELYQDNMETAIELDNNASPDVEGTDAPTQEQDEEQVLTFVFEDEDEDEDEEDSVLNNILADAPRKEHETVASTLATQAPPSVNDMLKRQEASDLGRIFTLNDKMRFRRALFHQNDNDFASALDRLALLPSYAEATRLVTSEFGWDLANPDVEDFMSIIRPHYPA